MSGLILPDDSSFQLLIETATALLGRYYAARHSHGPYRSCAVTGVYRLSKQSEGHFTKLLRWASKKTIEQHKNLCYGITEKQRKIEAQFVQLKAVNWEDVVEFRASNLPSGVEDEALSKELESDIGISGSNRTTGLHGNSLLSDTKTEHTTVVKT